MTERVAKMLTGQGHTPTLNSGAYANGNRQTHLLQHLPPAESEKIMKKRTNETIGKYYSVIVDSVIFTAKLTPCEMCKEYNTIAIKNSIGYTIYTSIKRDYLSIYEIISEWVVKAFNAVKGLIIIEA